MKDADTTEKLEGSQPAGTNTLIVRVEIPICGACLEHRKVGQQVALQIVLVAVVGLVVTVGLDSLANPRRGSLLYGLLELLAIGALGVLLAAPLAYLWDRRRWRGSHPEHAAVGRSVRIYWTPFGAAFEFRNQDYAEKFKTLNSTTLVRHGAA